MTYEYACLCHKSRTLSSPFVLLLLSKRHHPLKLKVIFCVQAVVSPLLSNLVLDELDRELELRDHRFVRYADDCNIYVRSERAGQRVMESVTRFITQELKLKVNEAKSAVARPQERKFLGFSFTAGSEVKRTIAPKALDRFKQRIREITRRAKGVSMETTMEELAPYMRGWRSYFGFCETPEVLIYLTRWVRLRLRAALWRQWKTPRRRRAALLELGVRPRLASNTAGSGLGPWYLAKAKALSVGFRMRTSNRSGCRHCSRKCRRNHLEPPYTDPYVRWCGRGRRATAAPMPIKSACVLRIALLCRRCPAGLYALRCRRAMGLRQ